MSETSPAENSEAMSARFAQMVMQQSNMAFMLLGKVANPATGEFMRDLDAAQYFIEQLEMIEVKTRGNLSAEEAALLKQSLMSLRLAFVEAVEKPAAKTQPAAPIAAPEQKNAASTEADAASEKKFSKKY